MSEQVLTIEETNKLRVSLGLAPLEEGGSKDKDSIADENYSKLKEDRLKKAEAKRILESIEQTKSQLQLQKKFVGKSLGSKEDDNESAAKWLKKNREKIHESAKTRSSGKESKPSSSKNRIKASEDEHLNIAVGHDMKDFAEGSELFLTLKDTSVLEDGDDELVSIQLQERDKLKQKLDNKRKKSNYNPYDDEEERFGVGNSRPQKTILAHYDETLDGPLPSKKGFKINAYQANELFEHEDGGQPLVRPKGNSISLDFENLREVKDYYTKEEAEVVFKKPKNKKKKLRRKEGTENPEEHSLPIVPKSQPQLETNFVDDDDLQLVLAKARRVATKRAPNLSEERFIEHLQVKQEEPEDEGPDLLTISDTSEFIQYLTNASALQSEKMLRAQLREEKASAALVKTEANVIPTVKQEEDGASIKQEDGINQEEEEIKQEDVEVKQESLEPFVEDEKPIGKGLASVLEALSKKGLYSKPTEEQIKRDRIQSEHSKWILEQRRKNVTREKERIAERHRDHKARQSGQGRDRDDEYHRDRSFAEEQQSRMANYRPDITIKHLDPEGNVLTPKEAFRQLSHKFHGKAPGMKKTEKRLAKIENAKKLASMTSSDTPLGTASALAQRQKDKGTAHIVLDGHK
ncbi:hypothetical protein DSO57_1009501 [Entomophthora muscae]|uniref:Uncharacterized protein n=1 Tax=Entomophthora muscae TaxID=34485 RepID=A0ACC2US75_9FUNG|nr:hypothetical protein DSO57_1009501 [Entomophthora muscae]